MNKQKSSPKLYAIDTHPIRRFTKREKTRLALPESLLEEYSLNKTPRINMPDQHSPHKEYSHAEGYEFAWGTILERRTDAYIVWDYGFSALLTHYLRHGKRLNDLQRALFYELERAVDHTTRDIVQVLGMTSGWYFIPTSSVGGFTQVIHFTSEKEAKAWTVENLLYQTLPNIVARLLKDDPKTSSR